MTRFSLFLLAAALAFAAGWLFGNEYRPPRITDVNLAMWIFVGGFSMLLGAVASASRG